MGQLGYGKFSQGLGLKEDAVKETSNKASDVHRPANYVKKDITSGSNLIMCLRKYSEVFDFIRRPFAHYLHNRGLLPDNCFEVNYNLIKGVWKYPMVLKLNQAIKTGTIIAVDGSFNVKKSSKYAGIGLVAVKDFKEVLFCACGVVEPKTPHEAEAGAMYSGLVIACKILFEPKNGKEEVKNNKLKLVSDSKGLLQYFGVKDQEIPKDYRLALAQVNLFIRENNLNIEKYFIWRGGNKAAHAMASLAYDVLLKDIEVSKDLDWENIYALTNSNVEVVNNFIIWKHTLPKGLKLNFEDDLGGLQILELQQDKGVKETELAILDVKLCQNDVFAKTVLEWISGLSYGVCDGYVRRIYVESLIGADVRDQLELFLSYNYDKKKGSRGESSEEDQRIWLLNISLFSERRSKVSESRVLRTRA